MERHEIVEIDVKKNQVIELSEYGLTTGNKVLVVLKGKVHPDSDLTEIETGHYIVLKVNDSVKRIHALESSKLLMISSISCDENKLVKDDHMDRKVVNISQINFMAEKIHSGEIITHSMMTAFVESLKVHDPFKGDEFNRYFDLFLILFESLSLEPLVISKTYCARICAHWVYLADVPFEAVNEVIFFIQKVYQVLFMPYQEEPLVRNAIYWVLLSTNEKKTVQYIADKLFTNRTHLSERFKQLTGISLSQYILSVKLYGAMVLLLDRNLTNTDIIEILGYKDEIHFSKKFKAFVGLTPSEFTKKFGSLVMVMNRQKS